MTMKKPPLRGAKWLRDDRAENPKTFTRNILEVSIDDIGARMDCEVDEDADDQTKMNWVLAFCKAYPMHLVEDPKPDVDLTKLPADQLLDLANKVKLSDVLRHRRKDGEK